MPIIARKPENDFVQHQAGLYAAVVVDVVDRGIRTNAFQKEQHEIGLTFETDTKMEDGRPYTIQRVYNNSLHLQASLYRDLASWLGKFMKDGDESFDLETLIGKTCQLHITEQTSAKGNAYTKIAAILKADPAKKIEPSGKYVRKVDREKAQPAPGAADAHGSTPDDAIPY